MSKLQELIDKLCPDGVEYRTLGELFDMKNGYTPSKKQNEYWENGNIPWFRMEDIRTNGRILNDSIQHINNCAVKNKLFPNNSLIVATTATIGVHALITTEFLCNQQLTNVSIKKDFKDKLNIKFCFYYFDIIDKQCINIANQGGGMPIVSLDKMKTLLFPVPPLEVQCEIVNILDTFEEYIFSLKKELTLREKSYEAIMYKLLKKENFKKFDYLENYSYFEKGKTPIQKNTPGCYPLVATTEHLQTSDNYQFDGEAVCLPLISARGHGVASITRIYYQSGKFALGNILCAIIPKDNRIKAEFLRNYLFYHKDTLLVPLMRGGANVSLTVDSLKKVLIPIPSINEQQSIIERLRVFQEIISKENGLPAEIEKRQKQYEYYRDKLLTFKELKK